jgi:hypothetical protein
MRRLLLYLASGAGDLIHAADKTTNFTNAYE